MKISFRWTRKLGLAGCGLLLLAHRAAAGGAMEKRAADDPAIEQKIAALIGRMTLEEKVSMLGGTGFTSKPIPRLGIPTLNMSDGPVGVRWGKSSAFPVSIAMAATWDTALVNRLGWALGREAKAKGRNMLLGPCVNINRVPQDGRSFESFGEDPYLASRMTVSYIEGLQSQKVIATTKHFACNNQEVERGTINVKVDERTLREIYLPAFEASVKEAGAWAVMSAYNRLNGAYCSENADLLTAKLKNEWGFRGLVVSDWGAVHSTVPTANAGLDIEMPTGIWLGDSLLAAVKKGEVAESAINDKVARLLRAMFWAGLFGPQPAPDTSLLNCREHQAIALDVARNAIVLLKNSGGLLPLDRSKIKTIAVIGPNAAVARVGGGGSAQVDPIYAVSPLEGLTRKVGSGITVRSAEGCPMESAMNPVEAAALRPPHGGAGQQGLLGEYFDNMEFQGKPVLTRIDRQIDFDWGLGSPGPGVPSDRFSVRWTGWMIAPRTGDYALVARTDDGVRLYLDDTLMIENWGDHPPQSKAVDVRLEEGKPHKIRIEYYDDRGGAVAQFGWRAVEDSSLLAAMETARSADVALVFVGDDNSIESEGSDRTSLDLPSGQERLIRKIAGVNKNTVVVLTTGAPVLMNGWLDKVPALLEAWFDGEEEGNAIADVLFGDVNPSGKLPVTFLKQWKDSPGFATYPGKNGETEYAEGIFVGYRYFDKNDIAPLFPFGFGLSYTSFAYDDLRVTPGKATAGKPVSVSVRVRNSGKRSGAETVQLYVREVMPPVPRPPKELKGFAKVELQPGEAKTAHFKLDNRAFAHYDAAKKRWVVDPGKYEILVGSSSRDIRMRRPVEMK